MSDVKKTKLAQGDDRAQKAVQVASPSRVQQARKAGAHGKIKNADGSSQATPSKNHKKTSGGNQDGY